jgi:hypothetical protein
MTGTDKSTKRAVAVIVLLAVVASALRGYLPGHERVAHEQPVSNPLATFVVVVLLSMSVGVLAVAVILRLRRRRTVAASNNPLPESAGGSAKNSTWRFLMITLAVIIGWLLINMLLARLGPLLGIDAPAQAPASSPPPAGTGTTPPPAPRPEESPGLFGYLAGATGIMLLLVAAGAVAATRVRPRGDNTHAYADGVPDGSGPATATESLARAAELGLAEIGDFSREPREAIIACYAAMERELMRVPSAAPQDCDTPTEVLARAVEHDAVQVDSATKLVDLFEEARFSPHLMNEGHRDVAVRALRLVLAELRSVA